LIRNPAETHSEYIRRTNPEGNTKLPKEVRFVYIYCCSNQSHFCWNNVPKHHVLWPASMSAQWPLIAWLRWNSKRGCFHFAPDARMTLKMAIMAGTRDRRLMLRAEARRNLVFPIFT